MVADNGDQEQAEQQRTYRDKRHANLREFKPGQSGNPGGRPKGSVSIARRLHALLAENAIGGKAIPGGKTVADVLTEVVLKQALRGDFRFAKEVLERIDGKVPDRIIDETPDASAERDRTEVDSILATLRGRGGIAAAPSDSPPLHPGHDGNGHIGG